MATVASSYKHFSAFDAVVESLASGMAVLLMLGTNNFYSTTNTNLLLVLVAMGIDLNVE